MAAAGIARYVKKRRVRTTIPDRAEQKIPNLLGGHGPVPALCFAVSLGPPWPGLLDLDVELFAGVAPQVGLVGRAVVGQSTLDDNFGLGNQATARWSPPTAVTAVSRSWHSA